MSQYEFDGNNDGEWEDNGDIAWNEADWQKFLRKSDKEISRFIAAYNKSKEAPDRLDAIASIMGWQNEDWASIDDVKWMRNRCDSSSSGHGGQAHGSLHPPPPHLHFTSALYSYLRNAWEHLMRTTDNNRRLIWHRDTAPVWQMRKHSFLAATALLG